MNKLEKIEFLKKQVFTAELECTSVLIDNFYVMVQVRFFFDDTESLYRKIEQDIEEPTIEEILEYCDGCWKDQDELGEFLEGDSISIISVTKTSYHGLADQLPSKATLRAKELAVSLEEKIKVMESSLSDFKKLKKSLDTSL